MKTTILKKAYIKADYESINELCIYLDRISGKELKIRLIRQYLFKTSWNEKDDKLKARCHLKAASSYLMFFLINEIKFKKEQIRIVIADLANYISDFDKNDDTSFIFMSTNVLPSAVHFKITEQLFYENNIDSSRRDNYKTDLLTIYSLRLSLEKRIRGLIGIDYATSGSQNIGLSTLIKLAKKLKNIKYSENINWTEIESVNKWLNHFMHRNIRPYPWIIHQALEVLRPLIDPSEPIFIDDRKIYSFYSASYVENESLLEKEITQSLKSEFPKIKVKWKNEREILKKKE